MDTNPSIVGSTAQGHLYWLDWLRFTAALMVVAIHTRGGLWLEWAGLAEDSRTIGAAVFFALTRAGTEWVLVFFVLSGFLVGGKVLERVVSGTFDLSSYVIDRVTRIWTPLLVALLWSAVVAYWVGKPFSWSVLLGNIVGLQGAAVPAFAGNYPLWSLAYETWFYVLAGGLAVWAIAESRERVWAGLALMSTLAVFTELDTVFLFAWILGAATYWLRGRRMTSAASVTGGIFIVVGYAFSQLRSATISVDTSAWLQFVPSSDISTLILAAGVAVMLPVVTGFKPRTNIGQSINKLGSRFAAFSYTMYLTHYPLLYVWEYLVPGRYDAIGAIPISWFLLRVASCVVFGWLCYLPFEKQTGRIRVVMRTALAARRA